jgi:nicotinamide riboside transporter PnuC
VLLSETTGWFYWTLIGVIGLALLAHTVVKQLHSATTRLAVIGLALLVATAFYFAYVAAEQVMS